MQKLTVKKPWGCFEQFTHNEQTTVKIIFIEKESSLSLQYHKNRSEFWHILSGFPTITLGDKKINAKPGDDFLVEKMMHHQIEAKEDPVQLLEIAYGDFDENDIIRLEDKYGRA